MGDLQDVPVPRKLRLLTYLSPGVPVQVFQTLRDYLEEKTGCHAYLVYENRWSGPPADREDPFTADEADIVFMCSTQYLRQVQKKNKHMQLCHAAPLHSHPMSAGRPVYFSELTVHKDNAWRYKDFHMLKGCRWAYNEDMSLSGNLVMLAELKKKGYNATFFGSTTHTGSHFKSIEAILNGQADAAAIDSNAMAGFKLEHPEKADLLHRVVSLGPMPIYPIVFNSRLSDELKATITTALLGLASSENMEFSNRLLKLGLTGYTEVSESNYSMESDIRAMVKNMSINPAYY